VAVASHGAIIWEEGFGWADREKFVRATADTKYTLASISKPILATGLMTLVQAGKMNLDRPVNDYLGDAKLIPMVGDARDATLRRLLNHTSGLAGHFLPFFFDRPYRPPPMDETVLHYGKLITKPGEHFEYSNLAYGILGYALSRVSHQAYSDFMRKAVFLPLGMSHTSVGSERDSISSEAQRYDENGARLPYYVTDHPAACEVYSSAHDLALFAMFHLGDRLATQKQVLTDKSLGEMRRPTSVNPRNGCGVGAGWWSYEQSGYRVVYHDGSMPGVSTLLMLIPSEDLAVVILTNSTKALDLKDKIVSAILPKWKAGEKRKTSANLPYRPDPNTRGSWKGKVHTYQGDIDLILEFLGSGEVRAKLGDQPETFLHDVTLTDGWLRGLMPGNIGTDDSEHNRPYTLDLLLKLRGRKLNGGCGVRALGPRTCTLTYWTEFNRI
jgi:CubicO group peptidase (beta-lactamase class C family)